MTSSNARPMADTHGCAAPSPFPHMKPRNFAHERSVPL